MEKVSVFVTLLFLCLCLLCWMWVFVYGLICVFVFIFRCSGGTEVMKVPRSSQWRSQLMTSGFGCWTPPYHHNPYPSLPPSLMALWGVVSLSLHCWVCLRSAVIAAAATASLPNDKPGGPLDWLLSDKGPFHHSPEYIDFVEKNRQGFSTRYKIYRWVMAARRRGTLLHTTAVQYCYSNYVPGKVPSSHMKQFPW